MNFQAGKTWIIHTHSQYSQGDGVMVTVIGHVQLQVWVWALHDGVQKIFACYLGPLTNAVFGCAGAAKT
jgi:hypothetical protein